MVSVRVSPSEAGGSRETAVPVFDLKVRGASFFGDADDLQLDRVEIDLRQAPGGGRRPPAPASPRTARSDRAARIEGVRHRVVPARKRARARGGRPRNRRALRSRRRVPGRRLASEEKRRRRDEGHPHPAPTVTRALAPALWSGLERGQLAGLAGGGAAEVGHRHAHALASVVSSWLVGASLSLAVPVPTVILMYWPCLK